ncbi:MAG: hypothetical protein IKF52_03360 [Clostridia bacterium]|nr:hypothetical protein [Clostridia bacterium]
MKFNLRKNKGITLVALVITIIVLLILAGVTLAMVVGDNGIVTRSKEAKLATEEADEKEKIKLAVSASKIDDIIGSKKISESLKGELDRNIGKGNYVVAESEDGFIVRYNSSGNIYEVNEEGEINKVTLSAEENEKLTNKANFESLKSDAEETINLTLAELQEVFDNMLASEYGYYNDENLLYADDEVRSEELYYFFEDNLGGDLYNIDDDEYYSDRNWVVIFYNSNSERYLINPNRSTAILKEDGNGKIIIICNLEEILSAASDEWDSDCLKYEVSINGWKIGELRDASDADNSGGY